MTVTSPYNWAAARAQFAALAAEPLTVHAVPEWLHRWSNLSKEFWEARAVLKAVAARDPADETAPNCRLTAPLSATLLGLWLPTSTRPVPCHPNNIGPCRLRRLTLWEWDSASRAITRTLKHGVLPPYLADGAHYPRG